MYDDPIWSEELRRYLRKEDKEREEMQERVMRLAHWREDVQEYCKFQTILADIVNFRH